MTDVLFEVAPRRGLLDEPIHIRIAGLPPLALVELRASTRDEDGRAWHSAATFAADVHGVVDVARDAPIRGSYGRWDAMGLLWAMVPAYPEGDVSPFAWRSLVPIPVVFAVVNEANEPLCEPMTLLRCPVRSGVNEVIVRERGLAGTLFVPSGSGPHPAVLVLGGSSGGLDVTQAALLASHGYAALALAYFAYEHLPPQLASIPLEYIEKACAWLLAQLAVPDNRVALIGTSRGAELALLAATSFPALVSGVIAYSPSSVLWGATGADTAAWTRQGLPLPHMANQVSAEMEAALAAHEPYEGVTWYARNLEDEAERTRCAIPVEKIAGPILLISGEDDRLWPATYMSEQIVRRLNAHGFKHRYAHLRYPHAGHLVSRVSTPYLPTTVLQRVNHATGLRLAYGGTSAGTAIAAAESWLRVLQFLREVAFHDAS